MIVVLVFIITATDDASLTSHGGKRAVGGEEKGCDII